MKKFTLNWFYLFFISILISFPIYLHSASAKDEGLQPADEIAKNVILIIPDGFSQSYATSLRWFNGNETTILDSLFIGMHRTYSANREVTDSAAGATAMATGVKTNNGMISMAPNGKRLKTILEAAEEQGKATGLVATSTITHATPAAFASHVKNRKAEAQIARQYIANDVDVLLGGGKKYFPDQLIHKAKQQGYVFVTDEAALKEVTGTKKLLGLFAKEALQPELDRKTTNEPSLADMTEKALEILNQDEDGFFLMVEASQIDWAGHAHDAAWAMHEGNAFLEAVHVALQFAKKEQNTLLVIAADHDTGGLSLGCCDKYKANIDLLRQIQATGQWMAKEIRAGGAIKNVVKKYTGLTLTDEEIDAIQAAEKMDIAINEMISKHAFIGWTTTHHTGVDIPVYAYGPGAEQFRGIINNIDFPVKLAEIMNIRFTPDQ